MRVVFWMLVLFLVVPYFVHGFLWGCDYKPCGPNDPHTMCKYPSGYNRMTAKCMGRGGGVREMTDEMRKTILDTHNRLRQKVAIGDTEPKQPTAANMMKLRYNFEAERIVQHWINQCNMQHDSCRGLKNGTGSGQNLYWADHIKVENETALLHKISVEAIQDYYNEIKRMANRAPDDIEKFTVVPGTGHYTAMTWANVKEIGCAWMQQATTNPYSWVDYHPFISGCNYVGLPNMIGGSQYKVGPNCSACPDGAHCSVRYPGLCTYESEEDEYNDVVNSSTWFSHGTLTAFVSIAVLMFKI